jgi:tetratricopeptide (TPR) repeat protein
VPAVAALLSRAVSLLPDADDDRLRLLPDLGQALDMCGDYSGAIAVLEEAIARAAVADDEQTRSYALLFRASTRRHVEPEFTAEEGLREAQEALRVFEELGDERGQALAWMQGAIYHHSRGHHAEARKATERALAHAIAAGDERLQDETRALIDSSLFYGNASLDEFASYAENLDQAGAEGRAIPFRHLLGGALGRAKAMRGEFGTARMLIAEERAALEGIGNAGSPARISISPNAVAAKTLPHGRGTAPEGGL